MSNEDDKMVEDTNAYWKELKKQLDRNEKKREQIKEFDRNPPSNLKRDQFLNMIGGEAKTREQLEKQIADKIRHQREMQNKMERAGLMQKKSRKRNDGRTMDE